MAIGALVVAATAVAGATAGERPARAPAAVAAFVTPTPNQLVPMGTEVAGECIKEGGIDSGRVASWELSTVIPRFIHGGTNGRVELAPTPDQLPRLAKGPSPPLGPFKDQWVLHPKLLALPADNCTVRSFDPLGAKTVEQPGPYVFVQYNQTVHFTAYADSSEAPPPQPCAANDPDFPDASSEVDSPPELPNETWVADAFCNTTKIVGFYVTSTTKCSAKNDTSSWSRNPYINQYDAGSRLRLPIAADGRRGGNACGPSSTLMAMLSGGTRGLPTLTKAYDKTMRRTAADVNARGGKNGFLGSKAETYLRSMGWKDAREHKFGPLDGVEQMQTTILKAMNGRYPVIASTAFGGARWGMTGGGHIIAIVGADARGNFIVNDPAGDYFGSPTGHYRPGKCGFRAVYPAYWLLAYTTGRYVVEVGKRTPRANRATGQRFGSAFSVIDTSPGSASAPRSFYLQDRSGRRTGWVNGVVMSQIPGASAAQDPPSWTDPSVGNGPTLGTPAATPRSIIVSELAQGTRLFVSDTKGARYSLTAESWRDGDVVSKRTLSGKGTGGAVVVSLPRS
jgi:hypothetical protein